MGKTFYFFPRSKIGVSKYFMELDFKNNLTLRTKMAVTKKVLKAKFDCI